MVLMIDAAPRGAGRRVFNAAVGDRSAPELQVVG
jgi:hypothetical protein